MFGKELHVTRHTALSCGRVWGYPLNSKGKGKHGIWFGPEKKTNLFLLVWRFCYVSNVNYLHWHLKCLGSSWKMLWQLYCFVQNYCHSLSFGHLASIFDFSLDLHLPVPCSLVARFQVWIPGRWLGQKQWIYGVFLELTHLIWELMQVSSKVSLEYV